MNNQANLIKALLANKSATFAAIEYTTPVTIAAKHSKAGISIVKTVKANVQLFANLKTYTDVYLNAVKKTAANIEGNNADNIENFEKSDTWFQHDDADCFSLVSSKKTGELYLFARFFKSESEYFMNGEKVNKNDVAQYMTAAAAEKFLGDNSTVYNVKNDVTHAAIVRTIKLENINTIKSGATIEF